MSRHLFVDTFLAHILNESFGRLCFFLAPFYLRVNLSIPWNNQAFEIFFNLKQNKGVGLLGIAAFFQFNNFYKNEAT